MKQTKHFLSASIALALGVSGVAIAATESGSVGPAGAVQIENVAEATYSVDGVEQPKVTSNAVIVNVSEVGSFTLVANQGASTTDDKNENGVITTPNGKTTFTNILTNTGSITDTYTITLNDNPANIIGGTDDFAFSDETTTDITVTIKNKTGGATVGTQVIQSGGKITLTPDQYAELSYGLTAAGAQVGQSGLATISATSEYITKNKPASATLVNENKTTFQAPIFNIEKTAANTSVDLNAANPTIDYTIKVTNKGEVTADGVLVQDVLPAGLTLSGNVTTSVGTVQSVSGKPNIIAVSVPSLAKDASVTITFKVNVDKAVFASQTGVTNHADVYDNFSSTTPTAGENPDSNIKDSTDEKKTPTNQPVDGTDPSQTGGDKTTPVSFTNRGLTLTGTGSKELPPTSSATAPAVYTHEVTNTGTSPEEIRFTITDTNGDNIDVTKVTFTPEGGNPVALVKDPSGDYIVPTELTAGKKGTISYEVSTDNATVDKTDTHTVTLKPKDIAGTTKPTVPAVTDTTTVKGLKLVKKQALDAACDGTADDAFANTPINAEPGQCIVYQITGTNELGEKALTNVVISDNFSNWSGKATFVDGSAKTEGSAGSVTSVVAPAVKATFPSVASGATATLQFSIKTNR